MYNTVLLDIEGTLCPISFVKDVLFPYFIGKIPHLVESRTSNAKIDDLLSQFGIANNDELVAHMQDLVARDVKDPILKQLQGYIWETGYQSGEIKAPLYADAIDLLKRIPNVYIYSSGSVKAQKLLFEFVKDPNSEGSIDLRPFIKGYFDITTSGKKTESQSYVNILKDIQMTDSPEKLLFLSDNPLELDAARKTSLATGLAIREGNAPVSNKSDYDNYTTFSKI